MILGLYRCWTQHSTYSMRGPGYPRTVPGQRRHCAWGVIVPHLYHLCSLCRPVCVQPVHAIVPPVLLSPQINCPRRHGFAMFVLLARVVGSNTSSQQGTATPAVPTRNGGITSLHCIHGSNTSFQCFHYLLLFSSLAPCCVSLCRAVYGILSPASCLVLINYSVFNSSVFSRS